MDEAIKVNDVFVAKDPREEGRTLRVVGVFCPPWYSLNRAYVACASRGAVTVFSYDRLLDKSRFVKYAKEVTHEEYGRGV